MNDSIASILFALIIILIAGQSVAGSLPLWHQIQELTTREQDAKQTATETFSYLHQRESTSPKIKGFTTKENSHMVDVKRTFRILEAILFVGFWGFLALLVISEKKAVIFLQGSCLVIIILLLLLVIPFDRLFVGFHQIFFAPGSWVFEGGVMISSFPSQFFMWLAQIWWMRAFTASLALALFSFILARKSKTTTLI